MKFMRLAACAVAFAVVGGMAVAEDMDIKALQAKLAAQEARLNDLQAKMGSGAAEAPASITSIKKNAKVSIGGDLDIRYIYKSAKLEQTATNTGLGGMDTLKEYNTGTFYTDTARINVQVDVNENMDAFFAVNLHGNDNAVRRVAEKAWVRWKNICNSGWGVKIGRDSLAFALGKPAGMFDAFIQNAGTEMPASLDPVGTAGTATVPNLDGNFGYGATNGDGMFLAGGLMPTHMHYGVGRITQINPYWESQDGKFRFDFTLFQGMDNANTDYMNYEDRDEDWVSANYGLGSAALKLTWKPTEDWTIVAGAINMYADDPRNPYGLKDHGKMAAVESEENNTAFHLGFQWVPSALCQKLTLWAQATQEFNAGWVADQDTFGTNFGLSYKLTDRFTAFAMGDYLVVDNDNSAVWNKAKMWRAYAGASYALGNGAAIEAGWAHDNFKFQNEVGSTHTKLTGDSIYTRLTFNF